MGVFLALLLLVLVSFFVGIALSRRLPGLQSLFPFSIILMVGGALKGILDAIGFGFNSSR